MPESAPDSRPNETPEQRADRNWNELLQELRVAQTGIQVLTGFLLTVPFTQRFTSLDTLQRNTYLAAMLLSVTATALLIAPVSTHRLLFRKHQKDVLVGTSDRLAKGGLAALALAMVAVILLVFDVVLGRSTAVVVALCILTLFVVTWVVLPLTILRRHRRP
jgi:hypothetical protein